MDPMPSTDTLLSHADRCMVAHRAADGPEVTPVACWSDGGGLWLTAERRGGMVAALRRDPACALWIAPPAGRAAGVAVDGTARVFDVSDPLGLVLHAPTVSAALTALALTHRAQLAGYLRDLPGAARAWLPPGRVLVRVRVDRARSRLLPEPVSGVGPVLPTELPAAVRRGLTGVRRVALATVRGAALTVQPAVWSAGFQLDVGATVVPEAPMAACVAVAQEQAQDPANRVGLALHGTVDSAFRFRPVRATWWQGLSSASTELRAPVASSGLVLPD